MTGSQFAKYAVILGAILLAQLAFPIDPLAAQEMQEIPVPTPRPERAPPPAQTVQTAPGPASDDSTAEKPAFLHRAACPALRAGRVEGSLAAPLREGDCGEDSPIEIDAASGVPLTGKPMSNCAMAEGLAVVADAAKRAAHEILGTELETIVTGPGYECRRRNRASTGKLSEHAFANAIDIAGFNLADGRKVTVEADWPHLPPAEPPVKGNGEVAESSAEAAPKPAPPPASERASTPEAKYLIAVRDAACTVFTTVLTPDSNSAHHAHLHFDLGCHGKTCTYLICE